LALSERPPTVLDHIDYDLVTLDDVPSEAIAVDVADVVDVEPVAVEPEGFVPEDAEPEDSAPQD
jgi:hypothetical protein